MLLCANKIVTFVKNILEDMGVHADQSPMLSSIILVVLTIIASILVYLLFRKVVDRIIKRITNKTTAKWDDIFFRPQFLSWCWIYVAAIICKYGIPGSLEAFPKAQEIFAVVIRITMILLTMKIIIEIIKSIFLILADKKGVDNIAAKIHEAERKGEDFDYNPTHSLKGLQQMLVIIVVGITAVMVISTLLGKNPLVIFSGLGAGAAVLMLIFKDSILGVVAGVQLTANDMLQPGDWITAPKYGIDGVVQDVTLATVKVQNWDKTIITVPPYSLVSDAFQNWRGMQDAKARRIKRSINIDMTTIHFLTPAEIKQYSAEPWFKGLDPTKPLANLSVFRRYLDYYICHLDDTKTDLTFMVRELQPTAEGLPLELYLFCANTEWKAYETIQADLLDFVLARLSAFGLRIYQKPSGADLTPRP